MKHIPFTNIPNPFYLAHDLSSEGINIIRYWFDNKTPSPMAKQLDDLTYEMKKNIDNITSYKYPIINAPVVFFINTMNQKNALSPVMERVKEKEIISDKNELYENAPPLYLIHFYGLRYLKLILFYYKISDGYKKTSLDNLFSGYVRSYGYHYYYRQLFKSKGKDVKALIVANDHSFQIRSCFLAARSRSVKTIYIQHASITPFFPSLDFSYALLEGADALYKYDSIGTSKTICFLTGIPKLDSYVSRKSNISGKIGICFNYISPIEKVEELIHLIKKESIGTDLIIRPHPGDIRRDWKEFCASLNVDFSDSKNENSFEFLTHVDTIISGSSNILLEAALMNVYPLKYSFLPDEHDGYAFQKNGIIDKTYTDPMELIEAIRNGTFRTNPGFQKNTKYYCDTIGTKYEGKSTEIVMDLLNQIIAKGSVHDLSKWEKIKGLKNLKAYRLKE